jgi:hypothetical protein
MTEGWFCGGVEEGDMEREWVMGGKSMEYSKESTRKKTREKSDSLSITVPEIRAIY